MSDGRATPSAPFGQAPVHRSKVLGIGLNKTGTTSLAVCLRQWGLRHISCDGAAFAMWRDGRTADLLAKAEQYDSFEDWPWALVYREIDERFPGTRFILTRRSSAAVWFDSLCKHAERTGPTEFRRAIYGFAMPHGHAAEHIARYERHLHAVRGYFADRPGDLLEVCWEEGDGWAQLAPFIGLPAPDLPFPHANRSPGQE